VKSKPNSGASWRGQETDAAPRSDFAKLRWTGRRLALAAFFGGGGFWVFPGESLTWPSRHLLGDGEHVHVPWKLTGRHVLRRSKIFIAIATLQCWDHSGRRTCPPKPRRRRKQRPSDAEIERVTFSEIILLRNGPPAQFPERFSEVSQGIHGKQRFFRLLAQGELGGSAAEPGAQTSRVVGCNFAAKQSSADTGQ
jgi:hypothetical protein